MIVSGRIDETKTRHNDQKTERARPLWAIFISSLTNNFPAIEGINSRFTMMAIHSRVVDSYGSLFILYFQLMVSA